MVVFHIAHQDGVDGAEEAAEALTLESHDLETSLSDDVGGTRLVFQESSLTKVVTLLVLVNGDGRFARFKCLCSVGLPAHDHEEAVAFLTLRDHVVTHFKPPLLDGICKFRPLICLHVLQDAHLSQEFLILFSLLLSGVLNDVVESAAIESPKL